MKKILKMEYNLAIRGLTAEMINHLDSKVLTAENGKKEVEIAKTELLDLILCDNINNRIC